jgi:photosystem II stability/assembly factor-like uncharacterized protein
MTKSFAVSANDLLAVCGGYIYATSDNGDTWRDLDDAQTAQGFCTAVGYFDSTVFLGTGYNGMFKSTDQGASWQPLNASQCGTAWEFVSFHSRILLASNADNIFQSLDSGNTWLPIGISADGNAHHEIFTIAVQGNNIFAGGLPGGVFLSVDSGITWKDVEPVLGDTSVLALTTIGSTVLEGAQFGIRWSSDSGATWHSGKGLEGSYVFSLVSNDYGVFAGLANGSGVWWSSDSGKSWIPMNQGLINQAGNALATHSNFLFVGTSSDVYRRPLSDFEAVQQVISNVFELTLHQNFPNPLTTQTTLSLSNPRRQFVDVRMMDILGKTCAEIFSGNLDAGERSFEWNASGVPDGVYFCVVRGESGVVERAVVVRH